MRYPLFIINLLLLCLAFKSLAQQRIIHGMVLEAAGKQALGQVSIQNIYTNEQTLSDSSGLFKISVEQGQLIEFRKAGFKIARMRIPKGVMAPYFKIILSRQANAVPEYVQNQFKADSIRYRELYKTALNFPKLSAFEALQHPFSALSKKNRMIWAFQDAYSEFEKQKYIDYMFNDALITQMTGIKGDSLVLYKRYYTPSYEFIRKSSTYDFYLYINKTGERFKGGNIYNFGINRSAQ